MNALRSQDMSGLQCNTDNASALLLSYIDAHTNAFIVWVSEAVAIPSVHKMSDWLAAQLRTVGVDLGTHVMNGQTLPRPRSRQQPSQKDRGTPSRRTTGAWSGRGSDDKGRCWGWVNILQWHTKSGTGLPVNLLFCFEGMEENGSEVLSLPPLTPILRRLRPHGPRADDGPHRAHGPPRLPCGTSSSQASMAWSALRTRSSSWYLHSLPFPHHSLLRVIPRPGMFLWDENADTYTCRAIYHKLDYSIADVESAPIALREGVFRPFVFRLFLSFASRLFLPFAFRPCSVFFWSRSYFFRIAVRLFSRPSIMPPLARLCLLPLPTLTLPPFPWVSVLKLTLTHPRHAPPLVPSSLLPPFPSLPAG
ncbi:hypothetical protein B0H13DRAFT_2548716 [Mycena leptocephala]|nr:hypothetical protein B0H13DRAFT_2548716 [Mycena leptocephala]